MRRARRALSAAVSVVALLGAGASLAAAPAQAATPWWGLTSGARPTYINPNLGHRAGSQIQEIVVTTEEFEGNPNQGGIELNVGTTNLGFFATEPVNELLGSPTLTAPNIQAALEGPYGAGDVTVVEETGAPTYTFRVTSPAGEPLTVGGIGLGSAESHVIDPGAPEVPDGEIVVNAENLGDAPADGALTAVKVTDTLPPNLEAVGISGWRPDGIFAQTPLQIPCELATLTCTLEDSLAPYDSVEVRVTVNLKAGAHTGELNEVSVTGGGAKSASLRRPITVSDAPTPYGVETYSLTQEEEGGTPTTQAGAHPFQQTTTILLNQGRDEAPLATKAEVQPAGLAKDTEFLWPPGLIGNPQATPTCTISQFLTKVGEEENECAANTAVGVAVVNVNEPAVIGAATFTLPLFNLVPAPGEPARFGFNVLVGHAPVVIDTAIRSDGDYGVTVSSHNITQTAGFLNAKVSVWGVPGDSRHDNSRGWGCLYESRGDPNAHEPCTPAGQKHPLPFTSMPTSCQAVPSTTLLTDPWNGGFLAPISGEFQPEGALIGCNRVPFSPTIASEPTSNAATSPTGLDFDINIDDEGQTNGEGIVQSQIKKAVVTLPEGFTTNPSVAEGLHACPQAAYEESTVDGSVACPENSKVGEVEIESPLIKQVVHGSLFVAEQGHNPNGDAQHPGGNLLTIYMVAANPEVGILVKQALKVVPNPVTGQLTTEVDNIPQLPFSKFHLSFRQGQRSPLITPPTCGDYTVGADLYPYSNPGSPVHDESSFKITQGPEGLGCPSGTPPFHPGLEAGTINNAAGTYSPFYTHIFRKDSEQEITRFQVKLPTGLIAKLKGVSECSDAGVAAAKAREHEGGATEEEAHPSCPANSEVGHTLVGTGVGNVLAYAGGKLYLAGPYHGSPISLVSVNDAKVGPFDLGTVVVRFALDVNHETAEVSVDGANSDPIPHIVDGIPIHLRDIRAYVSRPNFALNPTSCAKKSTAATVLGSGANFASSADDVPVTVSSPFQAADCASLGFAPKLALNLVGKKTHRGALPAFKAVLTYPKAGAYANIAKAQVTLPSSEFLEQGHLKNVCTRKVFETGNTPGENCPANSIYGKARAVTPLLDQPLEGPVYLRTGYGTKLPELAAALNGPQISITLAGKIDSVHKKGTEGSQIRNTFAVVPDAPVERFTLELKGGKKGLLVNSTDVCKGTHKALAAFTGQNGKLDEYEPALKAQCGKGKGKGKKKSGAKKKSGK
jgi:hypothetical protein